MEENNIQEAQRSVNFRNVLWAELYQAKFIQEYLGLYLQKKKNWNYRAKFAYLIIAIGGLVSKNYLVEFSAWALVLVTVIALADILNKQLFPEKKAIEGMELCLTFYDNYFPEISEIWVKMDADIWNEEKGINTYYDVKKTEKMVNTTINEVLNNPDRKLKKEADKETATFFERFNNN